MRAARVTSFTSPLEITDLPMPVPGLGQVLVRIEASGLCHTDIHAARGDWPVKPSLPFTPGHEGVGKVEQVGPGVTEVEVGERVAIFGIGVSVISPSSMRRCSAETRSPSMSSRRSCSSPRSSAQGMS